MRILEKSLSIKNKILIVLSTLPILAISLIVIMAVGVFKDDKLAYIFDAALSSARGKASSIDSQLNGFIQSLKALNSNYDPNLKKMSQNGKAYFDSERELKAFMQFSWDGEQFVENFNKNKEFSVKSEEQEHLNQLMQEAWHEGFAVGISKDHPMHLYLTAKTETESGTAIVVLAVENENFFSLFGESSNEETLLFHGQRGALVGDLKHPELPSYLQSHVFNKDFAEGTKETQLSQSTYLASYARVGKADLYVISLVDKSIALSAVRTMMKRAALTSGLILCCLIIIGVFASSSLTMALRQLAEATAKVMDGDFTVKVDNKSGDEIGVLAQSFNKMTEEVSRLMEQTAENARMEAELQTANTVQETLFPKSDATIGPIQIYGKSVPASECGGDWWHYSDKGGKVFIWIGDATGHGVPAALLTSAARAVASVIEGIDDVKPSEALSMLNKAIFATSKGQMMMTFFLACIDLDKNTMTYCNASHDPPFLLSHEVEGKPKRRDYVPLMDVNSPRLGENPESEYKDFEMPIHAGDKVVFYTDGIVDVKSPDGDLYGERRFLKSLGGINEKQVNETVDFVFDDFNEFRQDTPLDDDVTLILIEYQKDQAA